MLFKDYVGNQVLSPITTYDKMKTYYPIQVIDLRFQVYHVTPKKKRLSEENDEDPTHTNLFNILVKQKEIKMVSDGKKLLEMNLLKQYYLV